MNIRSIKIKNHYLGWEFEEIEFTSNLTLLVGVSGVGKTQILRSIEDLKDITRGRAVNGLEWSIKFTSFSGNEFLWEGKFSVNEKPENIISEKYSSLDQDEKSRVIIEKESLKDLTKGDFIIKRTIDEILFREKETPKLSSSKSIINTLKEEDIISEVVDAFKKITLKDHTIRERGIAFSPKPIIRLKEKYDSFKKIKNSDEDIKVKLFLIYEIKLEEFSFIKERFKDIFPQIDDVKIEQVERDDIPFRSDQTIPIISIKERSVDKWIKEDRISSGMLRTFIHIAELFLSNDGSVILIDEFENSLGINCIDILTDDLIHETTNIQFIATSHHPYIINNIPYEYWKIVSRKGGYISIKNALDYKLGRSKQDAFIQLTKILERQ